MGDGFLFIFIITFL
jgi:hypothetical protein